ncbi:LTA synthase family protein [Bacillus kwashiorkori]|uniref:LTA synthase family protein n=1 Tax=Bacillus kwashiorkori TaxID=1522318 RepID=UPI00078534FA|nr:LTA synthase family protein [Bacillus kwashiorkori]
MRKELHDFYLLFFFIFAFGFSEVIFRLGTTGKIFSVHFLLSFIFILTFAAIAFLLSSLFNKTTNYLIACFFLVIIGCIYSSQLIYFDFFKTYYSIFSASNAGQVLEFWNDIWAAVGKNSFWLILFFLPALFLLIIGKRIFPFKRARGVSTIFLISCIVSSYMIGITTIFMESHEQNSAYDLYFHTNDPILSVEKLGILTTMRLDLQRQITGWSPKLHAASPVYPKLPSGKKEKTDSIQDEGNLTRNDNIDSSDKEVKPTITFQTLPIDFDKLIKEEKNPEIKEMHQYFSSVPPTEKNQFTGKYAGYNVIVLTAEGFSHLAVQKNVTPTLYKLVHEGVYFPNFYNPLWGVSTSDGEYVANVGLIPKSGVWSFYQSGKNKLPFALGNQLKKLGYKTVAYHNHTFDYYRRDVSHPNMGYTYKGVGNGLKVKQTWPESDLEMMDVTISEYIDTEPFHAYYMTVSGHMQYSFSGNYIAYKNRELVKDLPYSEQAKAYLATQIELDKALERILQELEQKGIADKTLIVLSADHYPYGLDKKTIDELAGHKVEENFDLYKSAFILYTKGMEPLTIDEPVSSLDIIPTVSNLLGLPYDSRLLMGRDVFSNAEPLVIFQNKSFITSKGRYNAVTREFYPVKGEKINSDYIKQIQAIVNSKFYFSTKILDTDYYSKLPIH